MNQRIKAVRQATTPKLNQWNFGARIGLSQSQYSAIENGKVRPNDRIIKLICTEFNVNETWLRTGDGDMYNPFKSDFEKELEGLDVLTADEIELIGIYQQLERAGQDDVRRYADEKLELQQARESKNEKKAGFTPKNLQVDFRQGGYSLPLEFVRCLCVFHNRGEVFMPADMLFDFCLFRPFFQIIITCFPFMLRITYRQAA
ncbi:MAG: helix-turn-helix transcriptional regulator [Treponema sp.]|jgi:transcriptional regulator with XRE-family HTH domain|nr:helix-turn-helix transcriptional regulator [Treponema sp.]